MAGNWKMHKTCGETRELIADLLPLIRPGADVVVCPPFTALSAARDALAGSPAIRLGAQNVFWKIQGAYTGQISPLMLTDLGVEYAIVGHSEARGRFGVPDPDFDGAIMLHFGDTDSSVNRKLQAALSAGLTPICCVGETIGERRAEQTDEIVSLQVENGVAGIEASAAERIVFAYEPVWAIGTGEVCGAEEADRVCGLIRTTLRRLLGDSAAESGRIQYGGSVRPDNAAELLAQPNIDGALVGGASLSARDFAAIVAAAPRTAG
jgi:triosephosphate isomerase